MQSSYYLSIKRYYIIMHKQGYVCVCVYTRLLTNLIKQGLANKV